MAVHNVLRLLALAQQAAGARRGGCGDDADCLLNGVCRGGSCACNSGWAGDACEALDVLPADTSTLGGAYGVRPNVTSWGGNPVEVGGKWHLYVAEMAGGCGLHVWGSNSRVTHAVSPNATGPYVAADTALWQEAHNPQVVHVPSSPNETFVLFHIGAANNGTLKPCGPDGHRASIADSAGAGGGGIVHIATSPSGPWSSHSLPFSCNNPAPMLHSNGTWFVVCGSRKLYRSVLRNTVTGPWHNVVDLPTAPAGSGNWEDAFLYVDQNDNWHVICHSWDHSNNPRVSGHYFSPDGLAWRATALEPYSNQIEWDDGHTSTVATRERPKLVLDGRRRPAYLFNGITQVPSCPGPSSACKVKRGFDSTYTFVQAVRIK